MGAWEHVMAHALGPHDTGCGLCQDPGWGRNVLFLLYLFFYVLRIGLERCWDRPWEMKAYILAYACQARRWGVASAKVLGGREGMMVGGRVGRRNSGRARHPPVFTIEKKGNRICVCFH